jgi:O-antigen ligase
VWFGAAALIGIGVPISISRTAFLGAAVGLALILPYWDARRLRDTGVAIVALAAVVFVAVPGLLGTLAQYLGLRGGGDTSLATRTGDYAAVAPFVDHSPIWGRGVGTFIPPQYRILDNQYLMSLIDTGVLGFIAIVSLFLIPIFCARDAWSHARAAGDDRLRDTARGLFAAAVVAAVCLATFDAVSFWSFFAIAMVVLGMCGAAARLAKPLASAPAGGRNDALDPDQSAP